MGLTTQADHENCNTTIATLKDQVQQEQDTTASTILENNQQKENVNNLKKEIVVYDDKVNVLTEQIEALENEIKEATTISNYNVQVREMQLEEVNKEKENNLETIQKDEDIITKLKISNTKNVKTIQKALATALKAIGILPTGTFTEDIEELKKEHKNTLDDFNMMQKAVDDLKNKEETLVKNQENVNKKHQDVLNKQKKKMEMLQKKLDISKKALLTTQSDHAIAVKEKEELHQQHQVIVNEHQEKVMAFGQVKEKHQIVLASVQKEKENYENENKKVNEALNKKIKELEQEKKNIEKKLNSEIKENSLNSSN